MQAGSIAKKTSIADVKWSDNMPEERFDTKDDVDDVIVILDEKPIEIRKS